MPAYISVVVAAKDAPPAGAKLEYTSYEQLNGHKVGVLNGAITAQILDQTIGGSRDYSYYNSPGDLVAALKSGKVDAFCADEPVALLSVNNNEGIAVIPGSIVEDSYGFIFPKGSPLKEKFDPIIERLEADGTLERLKQKWTGSDEAAKTMPEKGWDTPNGTLKMATNSTLEPIAYQRGDEVVGYEMELAQIICKELGYGLEIVNQDLLSCLAGTESGKFDFGGAGISITAERQEKMDFSVPEYHGTPVFVVRTVDSEEAGGKFFDNLAESFQKTFVQEDRWQLIASGLGMTVLISVCSGALGTLLGYLTVLARRSKIRWLTTIVGAYQALMGGIPLVVVLMVLYYVVFGSLDMPGAPVAIIAFTLAFGSTAGSTMWTAVDGIDTIQEETGLALGYTRKQVFQKIIFPQARQQFMPQLAGQFVSLVKDTAIVGYIAVQDLTRASDLIRARTMEAFFPLISTAIIYFLFCRLLAWALGKVAARMDVTKRPREIEGVVEDREVSA
jgi:polar amino acid transport system substrate-binding protein